MNKRYTTGRIILESMKILSILGMIFSNDFMRGLFYFGVCIASIILKEKIIDLEK